MHPDVVLWPVFGVLVASALAIDLGIFQRRAHVVSTREAVAWTLVWVALALAFNLGVWHFKGRTAAAEFLAGYLIEKSLSVDNIFVFVLIFSYFAVPAQYQSRILVWGILGALVMRGAFVAAGAALLAAFHWVVYVFGALLVVTGVRLIAKTEEPDPGRNPVVRLARRFLRFTDTLDGQKFLTRVDGRLAGTPLLLVVLVVETTDLIFAVDSIPAIFAITSDPFIVYTSNIFAVLGLRSLYFLVAHLVTAFRYLKYGLVLILWFVGAKLLLTGVVKIPIGASLAVIGAVLAGSIVFSLLAPARAPAKERSVEP